MPWPTTGILDSFNRANEDPLSGGGNWGGKWVSGGFNLKLLSNSIRTNTAGSEGDSYWNTTFAADQEVYLSNIISFPTTAGTACGFVIRMTSPGASYNGYLLTVQRVSPTVTSIEVNKVVGGTATTIGSTTTGFSPISQIGMRVIGSTIEVYLGSGSGWTLVLTVTDTAITGTGKIGVFANTDTVVMDQFGGGSSKVEVSVSDSRTITESVKVRISRKIAVSDSVGPTESVQVATKRQVVVSDSITPTESVTLVRSSLNVNDVVGPSEFVRILLSAKGVAVSDTIPIAESVTILRGILAAISVADTIIPTDAAAVELSLLAVQPVPIKGRTRALSAPLRFCLTNLVDVPGVAVTASSQAVGFPAQNIVKPGRPMVPWRSTAWGPETITIDFLTPTSITGIWLVRTNFIRVFIQGNNADVWTTPAFSRQVAITMNPWNSRYQLAVQLSGFTYRYLRLFIPSVVPTDDSGSYLLGGVYAGVLERLPDDIRFDVTFTTVSPRQNIVEPNAGWRTVATMGEPLTRLHVTRYTRSTQLAPGYSDDVSRWQEIERRIRSNDMCALMLGTADTSQGFVVRPTEEAHGIWARPNRMRAASTLDLEEVTGP